MGEAAVKQGDTDELEGVVDQVLAAAGGDVRKAILGLVRGQHEIAAENRQTVSAGYVRRGFVRGG